MNIEDIKDPAFLKDLSYKELDELANDIRKYIIETVSEHGGHLSSNLGVVELTIALHRVFNAPVDKLLFDVGHQTYTHKILTGRAKEFKDSLRKYNGLSGYQKIEESEYDSMEAGHSSTSISIASGMALARDLNNETYNIVSIVGDASIVSGLSLEALNCLGNQKNKVIIILNDNNMSISKPIGGFHKVLNQIRGNYKYQNRKYSIKNMLNKTLITRGILKVSTRVKRSIKSIFFQSNIFEGFSLDYLGPYDGHDIKALEKVFKSAIKMKNSVVIHVQTKKGKGYEYSEKDKYGDWHGVAPFVIETGLPKNKINENYISWSECISDNLYEIMKNNQNVIAITPAMITGSKLVKIFKEFKGRSIDLGINEEHAVTFASGLALEKKLPYLCIYSTFMQRAYDNLNHDVARMNLPMVIGVDRAGLVGEDGDTHHGIYDVEITKGMKNSVIAMPYDFNDAKNIMNLAFNCNKLFFVRYPRGNVLKDNSISFFNDVTLGKWEVLNEGNSDVLVISTGPISKSVKELINNKYKDVNLLFARFYKPLDKELLLKYAKRASKIILYDIYSTKYGLYEDVCSFLVENNINVKMINMSIDNLNIGHGSIKELLNKLNLSIDHLDKNLGDIYETR